LDAELGPQGLKLAADAVHEFLRSLPGGFGGLDDLVAVLVRAGQKPRILAEQRMETAQAVRNDGRIGVPKMRAGVHVINRCRNVKRGGHGKAPFMVFRICRPQTVPSAAVSDSLPLPRRNGLPPRGLPSGQTPSGMTGGV